MKHRCTQIERNIWGDRQWHVQYLLVHSCLHLADLGCNHESNSCKPEILLDKFRYVYPRFVPFQKRFSTKSAEWIHPWSRINTVPCHGSHVLFLFASMRSPPLAFSLRLWTLMHNTSAVGDQGKKTLQAKPYHNQYTQPTLLSPY
jgi:hypothetical protein